MYINLHRILYKEPRHEISLFLDMKGNQVGEGGACGGYWEDGKCASLLVCKLDSRFRELPGLCVKASKNIFQTFILNLREKIIFQVAFLCNLYNCLFNFV